MAEFRSWATTLAAHPPERDLYRLKATYFEWSTYDAARRQLREHLNHYEEALRSWQQVLDDVEAAHVPLLRRRLKSRPTAEHEATIAFKVLAFRGEVSRARAEIAWAKQGLDLIDDLEGRGITLAGDSDRHAS